MGDDEYDRDDYKHADWLDRLIANSDD